MSTDLHDRTRQPSPDDGPDRPAPSKSSLSIPQVVGGALAAMTAAALGSRLSLAGTVVGAAFASVIAAVAGALYTASLSRTTKHVNAVLTRVRPGSHGATPEPSAGATTSTGASPAPGWASAADTQIQPTVPAPASTTSPAQSQRLRIGWRRVVVAALLMFVVAALALTGIELATGRALSGGTGTTVGQVAEPDTRPTTKPTESATAEPSATPTATATESSTPSATASSAPSSTPTAGPTPSATPTPSASATATPATTPTPSALASGAAGASPTP